MTATKAPTKRRTSKKDKEPAKTKPGTPVLFELDGPNVHPDNVDTMLLLRLATQYFHLIGRASETKRLGLVLRGIEVVDKCVAIRAIANDPKGSTFAAKLVEDWLAGDEEPPRGAETLTSSLRYELRRMPTGYLARAHVAKWKRDIRVPQEEVTSRPWEQVELRAIPLRVGGEEPVVKFRAESETADFILQVSPAQARILGGHLYEEIDIEVDILRDPDMSISAGKVLEVFPLDKDEPAGAWRTWFEQNEGRAWLNVDDVLAGLGRAD
jgi:hypothetical protein